MDSFTWQQEMNKYIDNLRTNDIYLKLVDLLDYIKTKYFYLISEFNKAKEELEKANKYYKDYDLILNNYQIAKTKLYSLEEVKEYFSLRHELEDYINSDLRELYKDIIF